MCQKTRNRGFTLIEVLVVVAIIALLIAVLLPALNGSRKLTRQVVCRSQIGQLALGMLYHATDDKAGVYIYTNTGAVDGLHFLYGKKYLPDYKIALCPSTRNKVDLRLVSGKQKIAETGRVVTIYPHLQKAARHREDAEGGHSYEIFAWHSAGIFPSRLTYNESGRITLPTTRKPAIQFIITDSDQDPDKNGAGGIVLGTQVYNNWPDEATNNHGKAGGNVGFLDGHGEWVTHRNWVPVHLKSAHLAWPEALARTTYFPGLRREARKDGGEGYIWHLR